MLVVCRVCASEYSIGTTRRPSDACVACDDEPAARHVPLVARPENPLRLAVPSRDRGLPARKAARPGRTGPRLGARLVSLCRSPAIVAAIAVAAMTSAVVARAGIVTILPQTAVLYAAAGLPVHIGGLVLVEATSVVEMQDGQPVLVVQGRVRNAARSRRPVPPVTVTLRGAQGETVYRWRVQPAGADLAAGETTGFRGRLAAPPPGIHDVELALSADKGSQAVASQSR